MKSLTYFLLIPMFLGVFAIAENCGELCGFESEKRAMAQQPSDEIPPCESVLATEDNLSQLDQLNCSNKTCHVQGFVKSEFTVVECRMDQQGEQESLETPMMIFTFQVVALPALEINRTL